MTHWIEFDQEKLEHGEYGLVSRLECELSRDSIGRIAICSVCKRHIREAPLHERQVRRMEEYGT
jgi:hypothetical protein